MDTPKIASEAYEKATAQITGGLPPDRIRVVDNPLRENLHTEVWCLDDPGQGGACHEYAIVNKETGKVLGLISFQNGPIGEVGGVNGCFQEDLMAITRDRLQHFQKGDYACRENALALTDLERSILWLNMRTAQREHRGVEGTHAK
jgi:hypothetical protein